LSHFADVATRTLGSDHRNDPGAGAAGGLGFALIAFAHAAARPGVEIVAELRGLAAALEGADAVYTGEGSIDAQTLAGKTVAGVARLAKAAGVARVVAFGGRVDASAATALEQLGVTTVAIADPAMPEHEAMCNAAALLERASAEVTRRAALP
jgi:glycerate kinase